MSPTKAMIFAARIGPMPKMSVRAVPEASTSSRMRASRSAIRLLRARTSRKSSEANCRLGGRRRITSRTNATEDAGRPVGREPARDATGDQVPQEPVEAVEDAGAFGDQVLASLREQPEDVDPVIWTYPSQVPVAPGGERRE